RRRPLVAGAQEAARRRPVRRVRPGVLGAALLPRLPAGDRPPQLRAEDPWPDALPVDLPAAGAGWPVVAPARVGHLDAGATGGEIRGCGEVTAGQTAPCTRARRPEASGAAIVNSILARAALATPRVEGLTRGRGNEQRGAAGTRSRGWGHASGAR